MTEHYKEAEVPRLVFMGETDINTIDKQISEGMRREETGEEINFLNNLTSNFPDGFMRRTIKKIGMEDVFMVSAEEAEKISHDDEKAFVFSDRARSTTWRSFFQEIDEVLEMTNVSLDEVKKLRADLSNDGFVNHTQYIVPVYRELRLRGYAHYELVR